MSKSEIELFVKKANKYIKSSELLLNYGDYESSVSRAYYSMYYMGKAVLLLKNRKPKTHSGVISEFSKYFIKTNVLSKALIESLKKGFEARKLGDYNIDTEIDKEEANDLLLSAKNFCDDIEEYLKKNKFI